LSTLLILSLILSFLVCSHGSFSKINFFYWKPIDRDSDGPRKISRIAGRSLGRKSKRLWILVSAVRFRISPRRCQNHSDSCFDHSMKMSDSCNGKMNFFFWNNCVYLVSQSPLLHYDEANAHESVRFDSTASRFSPTAQAKNKNAITSIRNIDSSWVSRLGMN
jgi:hypothetical protein